MSSPAVAAGWAALIMLAGLFLIAFASAGVAILSPETVRSSGFVPVSVIVVEVAQFLLAVLAGGAAQRRMADQDHGSRARRHLQAMAGPAATILAIDVMAVAATSTAWWRLLLDVAVVGLGAVLGGVRARRSGR